MATVLAPIVQPSSPITMPYSSSDAYQTPSTQSKPQQPRAAQTPRSQTYSNAVSAGTGYRGTSAPIAPYAFSSTPQLRQDNRSVSAPNSQMLHQARLGHPSHPSSSSDSTVSTSGSSNRSSAGPSLVAKGEGDVRKPSDNFAPSISLSIPDLSLSVGDGPAKPSPGRYRRSPGRTDSSSSTPNGATTPTQRSSSLGFPPGQSAQNAVASNAAEEGPSAGIRHHRANSADETQVPGAGGVDPAKRYRRRSIAGVESGTITTNMATLQVASAASQPPSLNNGRPVSSADRPASSQGHQRQGSAGSTASKSSSQPLVR